MAIIIIIKFKLLSKEYMFTINLAEVKKRIKSRLAKISLKPSLSINVMTFKFNREYVLLVNMDKRLSPYMEDIKNLLYKYAGGDMDLRAVVILAWEIEENPSAELRMLLISDGEEYLEKEDVALNGKTVKIIMMGKNRFTDIFPNLSINTLLSRGLVLYGNEFLREWALEGNE